MKSNHNHFRLLRPLCSFGGSFKMGGDHEWNIPNEISVQNPSFSPPKPGTTSIWTGTQIDFLQLLNHKIFQKVILVSFLHLSKLCIFAKLGGCGSKTKPATPS